MRAAFALLGAATLAAAAGCSSLTEDPPACPRVNVLQQARTLTLYGDGPGRDLSDVTFEIELRGLGGDCDYDVDEEEGGGVAVEFALAVHAARGPVARTDRVSMPYFVALLDARRQMVAKEVFTVEIAFEGSEVSVRAVEEIEQWIPLGPGEPGAAYETLVGIQFTPEQLEDSRRRER